jgi:uncharacterized protein (DUF58 family)
MNPRSARPEPFGETQGRPVEGQLPRKASTSSARADWFNPVAFIRARFRQWWQSRLTLQDVVTLTQRNVYILPTRPGFMLGVTLLVMLVASINYQLNLGYLLTFLLAGSAVVGMYVGHATLRGLSLRLSPPEPQFCGASASLVITLSSERRTPRYGIGLSVLGADQGSWSDVAPQGSTVVHVVFKAPQRGWHSVPTLTAETRFPLGTFRVWTVWRPAARLLVYPAPESFPPPLPVGEPQAGGTLSTQQQATGEFDGVRAYRRGDPLKLIVWKKTAKSDELVSRDAQQAQRFELWLDLAQTGHAVGQLEHQLSRLCAWVLEAEQRGLDYGLRLPGLEIKPGCGEVHKRRCLEALALC